MGNEDLRARTKQYALGIVRFASALPERGGVGTIARQVFRSGTSVGAHYLEACRARSTAEFVSKLQGGLQELEETAYWLELLVEGQLVAVESALRLQQETEELTRIFVASVRTAKRSL